MNLEEIENLVSMLKEARISELTVSADGTTVRLRKPLSPAAVKKQPVRDTPKATEPETANRSEPAADFLTAPMVGIFHSIDSVGARGNSVKAGQVVGVIESMKLMNDVIADRDGIIAEVLVEDGMPVEYGQNLFRLTSNE